MPTDNNNQPKPMNIDLSSFLANQSNAIIEFLYVGKFGWWWQIDNVEIPGGACATSDGGVAAGYVLDANNNNVKMMGAKVATTDNETITAPDDFEPANGLYWFFEKTSVDGATVKFTVSKPGYPSREYHPHIVHHGVTQHNFDLGLPEFVVVPASLEETMSLTDAPKTQTIQLENQGTVPGSFKIYEHDKGYQPVAPRALNLPVFTGESPERNNPLSSQIKPANQAEITRDTQSLLVSIDPQAKDYGITEVVPAFAMNMMRDPAQFYKLPNAANPGSWQLLGTSTRHPFKGDFLGSDFSTYYSVDTETKLFNKIDTTTSTVETITPLSGLVHEIQKITGANGFYYGIEVDWGVQT